jgi:hypothetical protein
MEFILYILSGDTASDADRVNDKHLSIYEWVPN